MGQSHGLDQDGERDVDDEVLPQTMTKESLYDNFFTYLWA